MALSRRWRGFGRFTLKLPSKSRFAIIFDPPLRTRRDSCVFSQIDEAFLERSALICPTGKYTKYTRSEFK